MTKIDLCNRIIEAMNEYKPSQHKVGYADDINLDTAERIIDVMQNIVRDIRDYKQRGKNERVN